MMNKIIRLGGILFIICAVAGGVLAFTNNVTKDKIAEADLKASMDPAILEAVMPTSEMFNQYNDEDLVATITAENEKFTGLFVAVDGSGNELGYAIKTYSTVKGFGGDIEIYVGISTDGKIAGMAVTQTAETKGLGTKVDEPAFKNQFIGKDASLEITEYDSITGATYSSKSFMSAVNNAINIYNKYLNK